ncbi:MAG: OmpA family protein [Bacteroidales bacterium]|nr:OmpA family protein [Bacteroidales bacterium]
MRKSIIFAFLFLTSLSLTYGQDDKAYKWLFMEAEHHYLMEEYSLAVFYLEDLLKMDPDNSNLQYLCGDCYLIMPVDVEKAIFYLEKAIQNIDKGYIEGSYKERNAPPEAYYALARAYHYKYDFDKAIDYYKKYSNSLDKRKYADIEFVNAQIKSCEFANGVIQDPVPVKITSAGEGINGYNASFNPVISGNDSVIIFKANRRATKAIMMSTREDNGWSIPRSLNQELGVSEDICYPASLSYDGHELYIVMSDYFNSELYVSHFSNERWSVAEKLGKNINTRYSETHASLSRDGNMLYFTSNRKGGHGALDIYMSQRESGDNWGPAKNLGPTINTFYNEEAPFLTGSDQKIYFSSQGHPTIGGYDIFYSTRDKNGLWTNPENLGYPVNSTRDNLFFNPGWNDDLAYSESIDSITGIRGIYTVDLYPVAEVPEDEDTQDEQPDEQNETLSFAPRGEYYMLNNFRFDFNDHTLNEAALEEAERIYNLMVDYPEIGIELIGHTDATGDIDYNLKLSIKRAESVADYLRKKDIDPDRIKVLGMGEFLPIAINKYEDGSDASEGRSLNRHVSIKLLNLQDENVSVSDIFVPDHLLPVQDLSFSVLLLQSGSKVDSIPDQLLGEKVVAVTIDQTHFYLAGIFNKKTDAMRYLNDVVDQGYPDARLIETGELEGLIK